jgi:hypothetical protein
MPFTHANTSDYSAPQTQEAASCGHKQCKECGKDIAPYFYCGNYRSPRKRSFCSKKCRNDYCAREYRKKHPSTNETKAAKAEYDKKYRERNHDKKIAQDRKWYALNGHRPDVIKRQQEYGVKYRVKHRQVSKNYEKRYWGRILEIRALRMQFGTAKLPMATLKQWALVHLGHRFTRPGVRGRRPIDMSEHSIKNILTRIEMGETYAAYE